MAKIFLVGFAPLPFENKNRLYAHSIRTWNFIQSLVNTGNTVCCVCLRIHGIYEPNTAPVLEFHEKNLHYFSVNEAQFRNNIFIQKLYTDFDPDSIVGVSPYSSIVISQLNDTKPTWIDLSGFMMTEAQGKAHRYQDNTYLTHFLEHEKKIIALGDKFSVVTHSSGHALIGELGMVGRLTKETFGFQFIEYIPSGITTEKYTHQKNVLRGKIVSSNDFVVLWSGGYNTWADSDTLFSGLELAMKENPLIKFVSLGGAIDGHDDITFQKFKSKIEHSVCKERFIFVGWVPTADVPNYYFESNIGINIDTPCYEALLGCRNRLIDMFKGGLSTITTKTTELSETIEHRAIGFVIPPCDVLSLKHILLQLANDVQLTKEYGKRAQTYVYDNLTVDKIFTPFTEWIKNPRFSPDREKQIKHATVVVNSENLVLTQKASLLKKFFVAVNENGFYFSIKKAFKFIRLRLYVR